MPSPWIIEQAARKPGWCQLFCLPFAGGGASIFAGWQSLSPAAEVVPVQLPGRENRLREPPINRLPDLLPPLVEAVGEQIFGPWAVFGHSFGGLVAFELARAAIRDGFPQPEAVVVSACRPPDVESRFPRTLHRLSDDELVDALEELGATPTPVLKEQETRQLVLPAVRADIELCETYAYEPDDVLEAPIIAFSGSGDEHADSVEMNRWIAFTHGRFIHEVVPGGHFFVKTHPTPLLDRLKKHLENLSAARRHAGRR